MTTQRGLLPACAFAAVIIGIAFTVVFGTVARHNVQAATAATLAIDADPTNGTGACNPVDARRTVATSVAFSVALCLQDSQLAPVNGGFNTTSIDVSYTGISAADVASDLSTDLNSNPNWNDTGLTGPTTWDCNLANSTGAAPSASPSPATIVCSTVSANDQPVTGTVLLATLNFDPQASPVTSPISWGPGSTSLLSGAVEAFCGDGTLVCVNASVTVGNAPRFIDLQTHSAN